MENLDLGVAPIVTASLRVSVDSGSLADALGIVTRAVAQRDTLPALTGVLFQVGGGKLTLTASNLNLSLRSHLAVDDDEAEGEFLLPGKALGELGRRLPNGRVLLETGPEGARISFPGGQFRLPLLERERFPDPIFSEQEDFRLPGSELRRLIRRVAFAAARGEAPRPILTGVAMQVAPTGLRALASDSVRVAAVERGDLHDAGETMVLPADGLEEIGRLLTDDEVSVTREERYAFFRQGPWAAALRFLEGSYPDFGRLLPVEYPWRVRFRSADLVGSLERLHLVAESRHPQVRLELGPDFLLVRSSSEAGAGEETVPVIPEAGGELRVVFNARYLLEILRTMEAEELRLLLSGAEGPAKLEIPGQEGEYYVILLPIRFR